jgi:hypothetical protein
VPAAPVEEVSVEELAAKELAERAQAEQAVLALKKELGGHLLDRADPHLLQLASHSAAQDGTAPRTRIWTECGRWRGGCACCAERRYSTCRKSGPMCVSRPYLHVV